MIAPKRKTRKRPAQTFICHAEANAVLYPKALVYGMAFVRKSVLFILTY